MLRRPRACVNHAGVSLAALALAAVPAMPLCAQEPAPQAEPEQVPAPAAGDSVLAEAPAANVYTPDYFARFAPRNALDMVRRIPGFTISDDDQGRGLGQANQNVIVDGERLSSKSDSLRDQLGRIPADTVVRIEIVEGNSLDIPGLTGQVANVVTTSTGGMSGQFEYRPGFRAYNTQAQFLGGEISVTGSSGRLDYTVALSNNNDRFGADGPNLVFGPSGALVETQETKFSGRFDNPKLATTFAYDFGGDTKANLNLSYGEDFFQRREPETGIPLSGPVRLRDSRTDENGPEYEIGGDIEFPLGPGTLKLIGLERFERDNLTVQVVDAFDDGAPSSGFRFLRTEGAGERIGRFEYGWGLWGADWQLSGEAAFNRLDRISSLFELDGAGDFVGIPLPGGTGGVTEDRYEAILSFGRQLTGNLSMQATAGGEYSKIEQTGVAANARSFQRPKGSFSLAWKPASDLDVSFEIRRRVGQLSFGDFLASVSLNDDNQNRGNNELVPDQSWDFDLEINKGLGAWGSAKLQLSRVLYEDFIDFFPLEGGGEARGKIGDARRTQAELNATLNLDPAGLAGARLEVQAARRWDRLTDPFTGEVRPFSGRYIDLLELDFRHDIPRTDWAYGAGLFTDSRADYSRLFEVGRESEGPTFVDLFVENKDVFGLTVRATYANILGARQKFARTVFDGPRPDAPILFSEASSRRIGPIFRFSISGSF